MDVEEIVISLWVMEVLLNQTLTLIDHLEWGFKFRQASLEECTMGKLRAIEVLLKKQLFGDTMAMVRVGTLTCVEIVVVWSRATKAPHPIGFSLASWDNQKHEAQLEARQGWEMELTDSFSEKIFWEVKHFHRLY